MEQVQEFLVRIPKRIYEAMWEMKRETGYSLADIVRTALREYLEKEGYLPRKKKSKRAK